MRPSRRNRFCAWRRNVIHWIIVDGLLRIVSPFLVLPALLIQNKWFNPLWIFLQDDTSQRGVPQEQIRVKSAFLKQWNELGLRNHCANLQKWLENRKQAQGAWTEVWFEYCETWEYLPYSDCSSFTIDNTPNTTMLRAKFFNDKDDSDNVHNRGDYLSFTHSTFGRKKYFYKQGNKWYVLYSHCWIVSYKNGIYTIKERSFGASDRILIRRKKQFAR